MWQPQGVKVLWLTSVPLLAYLAAPLTLAVGPLKTYDFLVLTAPVLTSWSMYRLCLSVTSAPAASLIGGFLLGFSTYEMAQSGTLNLSMTCLIPCLLWLAVARLRGRIGRAGAVGLLALLMIGQFLLSLELAAMAAFFGSLAWCLAYGLLRAQRAALRSMALDSALAAAIALLVLSPCIVSLLSSLDYVHLPAEWHYFFTASLEAAIVPGSETWLSSPLTNMLIHNFDGDVAEQDSYLGIPLLLIVYAYGRGAWQSNGTKFLVICLGVLVVSSLGPVLWVGRTYTGIPMPWAVPAHLPLLGQALPVRFALFESLVAGLIAAIWIGQGGKRRLAAGLLACIVILPAPHRGQPAPYCQFFAPDRAEVVLGSAPQLLVLPFAINGASTYWQVENQFGFSQTGGYLGFPPAAMQVYPAVQELFSGKPDALVLDDFVRFVMAMKTQYIVAGPGTKPALIAKLDHLEWPERRVDDVIIYTVPAAGPHA
jgi:hypothetical protein